MKKKKIYKILFLISLLLIILCLIILTIDFIKYNTMDNSSPFYTFIIIRIIEFILPSTILAVVGNIIKNK